MPAPTENNLLVFYIPNKVSRDAIVGKLMDMRYPQVKPETLLGKRLSHKIEDPVGWRIVNQNTLLGLAFLYSH
jgi:hypothetical protein